MKLRCLEDMPRGYCCDCSKFRGHRCDLSAWEALSSSLSPRHNEFWNVLTDVVPLLFFVVAALDTVRVDTAFTASSISLQRGFLATAFFTVLQHACSFVAHTFSACSPRLSHTIWYLDYMGIGLNFMWNAPAAALVALGPNASEMDVGPWISGWFAMNACLTGPLVALAVWATVKHEPSKTASWLATAAGSGPAGFLVVALVLLPNLAATLAAGLGADTRGLTLLAVLIGSLGVKELHFPEALWPSKGSKRFDFSAAHSHVLWHLGVWVVQILYLVMYMRAMGQSLGSAPLQNRGPTGNVTRVELLGCAPARGLGASIDALMTLTFP